MNKRIAVGVVGGALALGLAAPTAAYAAPAGSGASIVAESVGGGYHTVCASQDFYLDATGFAPNRAQVIARIQIAGSGALFDMAVPLHGGAGTANTGTPGPFYIGDKFRVRYETGSSGHKANYGSYSGTIVDC